jgi:predicted TIM-barrel fold metal-dependent hydrolase
MAGLVAHSLSPTGKCEEAKPVTPVSPIVDCHQHLWNLDKFKLPWIEPGTLLGRSYVMKDYLAAIEGTGIKHAVYMEVDVDPAQQMAEAEHLIEICKSGKTPTIAAVISGRPAAAGFKDYITPLAKSAYIKGVRQVLHGASTPAGYCLAPDFVRGIQLLGELGRSFDLCMRPKELKDGVALARQCPETRFIVDHCGNADVKAFFKAGDPRLGDAKPDHESAAWKRDIESLASQKNVICKISGIIAQVPKEWSSDDLAPIVNHCLGSFGPDRVIFGSDWPVCLLGAPLKAWVAALREIIADRPEEEQNKLWSENAKRFYALTG